MVRAGERALTVLALERLGAGVFAQMSCQLVRPSEAPLTVGERALERPFSYPPRNTHTVTLYTHTPLLRLFVYLLDMSALVQAVQPGDICCTASPQQIEVPTSRVGAYLFTRSQTV